MTQSVRRLILTLSCPSTVGIVSAVSGLLAERGWNIIESAQFVDRKCRTFFMRMAFETDGGDGRDALAEAFELIAQRFGMDWKLHDPAEPMRVLIMVSRFDHCLNDLLYRYAIGALPIVIPAIVSNHRDAEVHAARHGIPFHHLPVTAENKRQQERRLFALIERERIQLVVLARYMQILSDDLCRWLAGRAINIHHSFLPSFKGAKPYHQAHDRGVKLIGATAHYVTPDLDEGPIIEQDVRRVGHAKEAEELAAVGRDVESSVLARAVQLHVEHRVLLNGNRTVVFD